MALTFNSFVVLFKLKMSNDIKKKLCEDRELATITFFLLQLDG